MSVIACRCLCVYCIAVADLEGVMGVQMHLPLAASSVFLHT